MSSASSERRSVPAIENGCIVGTWLSQLGVQRAVLADREADGRVREAERVAELVHLGRAAVEVGARPVDDQEHVVDDRVARVDDGVARAEAVDRLGGEAERAQGVAGLVEDHLLLAVAGQVAPSGLVVGGVEVDRVAAPVDRLGERAPGVLRGADAVPRRGGVRDLGPRCRSARCRSSAGARGAASAPAAPRSPTGAGRRSRGRRSRRGSRARGRGSGSPVHLDHVVGEDRRPGRAVGAEEQHVAVRAHERLDR